ncbi:hypothetical protein [Kitasatospora sp. NPDC059327]|uniref:hypothetical protein n=1 Tax=Kitasatospora sp. NPDC059327 TaxID=3346803 RepID=UPI003681DA33
MRRRPRTPDEVLHDPVTQPAREAAVLRAVLVEVAAVEIGDGDGARRVASFSSTGLRSAGVAAHGRAASASSSGR